MAAAGLPPDGEKVLELVRCGARNARRVWDGVVDAVAAGVHNLVHLFTPASSSWVVASVARRTCSSPAESWVVDIVPHLAYGAVTAAVLERLDDD